MTRELQFHPYVAFDILDITDHYESERTGLGERFFQQLLGMYAIVRDRPLQFGRVWRTWRIALVDKFPYKIVFRVEPYQIYVLSVIHVRRHDRIWKARV